MSFTLHRTTFVDKPVLSRFFQKFLFHLSGLGTRRKVIIMAKVVFSDLIVEMRGKVGGAVYSKNKGGAYRKRRTVPSNPQTAAQIAVRSKISTLSQAWKTLTSEQQAAWQAATAQFQYVNNLGQLQSYTAQALFMALNSSIRAANPSASLLTSPPAPASITNAIPTALVADEDAGEFATFEVTFSPTVPAGHTVIVQATRGMSPGVTRPSQSDFRQIRTIAAGGTSPADLGPTWNSVFGGVQVGQKVFVKFITVVNATGQRAEGGQLQAVVEAL